MSQSSNDSFESKLHERLENFEAPPPPGASDFILDKVNSTGGAGSRSMIWLLALVGLVITTGGAIMVKNWSSEQEIVESESLNDNSQTKTAIEEVDL